MMTVEQLASQVPVKLETIEHVGTRGAAREHCKAPLDGMLVESSGKTSTQSKDWPKTTTPGDESTPMSSFSSLAYDEIPTLKKHSSGPFERTQRCPRPILAALTSEASLPFSSRPVTLLVGEAPSVASLVAHEEVLTSVSSFFRAALRRRPSGASSSYAFSETFSGVVALPEARIEDITYLLRWAYWRNLEELNLTLNTPIGQRRESLESQWLFHHLIDPPLRRYSKWRADKVFVQQSFGRHSSELLSWLKRHRRPRPPAFGPLVKLYTAADMYGIERGLKDDICQRVKDVGRLANCVPDADDIDWLWENVVGRQDEGLKKVILSMYASLSKGSIRGVMGSGQEIGDGKWHPVFMRDLVVRLIEGPTSATGEKTSCTKDREKDLAASQESKA